MNFSALLKPLVDQFHQDPVKALAMAKDLLALLKNFPSLVGMIHLKGPIGEELQAEPDVVIDFLGDLVQVMDEHPKVFLALVQQFGGGK